MIQLQEVIEKNNSLHTRVIHLHRIIYSWIKIIKHIQKKNAKKKNQNRKFICYLKKN